MWTNRTRACLLALTLGVVLTSVIMWSDRQAAPGDALTTPTPLPPTDPEILAGLFADDVPEVRITACELATESRDGRWMPALLRRASDREDRVRHAAFAALSQIHPQLQVPVLATSSPEDDSRLLLWWIDQLYGPAAADRPSPMICEIWADSGYVAFSPILTDACLDCHAGRTRGPFARNEQCQGCHESLYTEWAQSAHAQSLLHLHLPVHGSHTMPPTLMDFGEVRGIGCLECHILDASALDQEPAAHAASPTKCIHTFTQDASSSCARCHPETNAQWRDWTSGKPQPRKAPWPPGHLNLSTGDRGTCTDCHMPQLHTGDPGDPHREHRWSARRNASLLRDGIHVLAKIEPDESRGEGRCFTAVLTNTSGHAYPTGTCRRTLELLVESTDTPGERVAARIGSTYPGHGRAGDLQTPLAPGERREIRCPLPPAAESVNYRLRYIRDRLIPELYSAYILTGTASASPWIEADTTVD